MGAEGKIKLGQVPDYIEREYGLVVSRQSVYRWHTTGRRGMKLEVEVDKLGRLVTTKENVDDFLNSTGYQV